MENVCRTYNIKRLLYLES